MGSSNCHSNMAYCVGVFIKQKFYVGFQFFKLTTSPVKKLSEIQRLCVCVSVHACVCVCMCVVTTFILINYYCYHVGHCAVVLTWTAYCIHSKVLSPANKSPLQKVIVRLSISERCFSKGK